MKKKYTLTKRISKHGSQAILIIPRLLEKNLSPGTIVEVSFRILQINSQQVASAEDEKPLQIEGGINNGSRKI